MDCIHSLRTSLICGAIQFCHIGDFSWCDYSVVFCHRIILRCLRLFFCIRDYFVTLETIVLYWRLICCFEDDSDVEWFMIRPVFHLKLISKLFCWQLKQRIAGIVSYTELLYEWAKYATWATGMQPPVAKVDIIIVLDIAARDSK